MCGLVKERKFRGARISIGSHEIGPQSCDALEAAFDIVAALLRCCFRSAAAAAAAAKAIRHKAKSYERPTFWNLEPADAFCFQRTPRCPNGSFRRLLVVRSAKLVCNALTPGKPPKRSNITLA